MLAMAAFISTFLMVIVAAVSAVSSNQQDTAAARTPITAEQVSTNPSLTITSGKDAVDGRGIERTVVFASPGAPLVPGLRSWPEPNTMATSPAFADILSSNPALKARYPWPITGSISPSGLIAPDELVVYVNLGPAPSGRQVTSFGIPRGTGFDIPDRVTIMPILAGAMLLIPISAYMAAAARLEGNLRDRRVAALRLIGLSARRIRWVNGVEPAISVAIGTLLGLLAFNLLRPFTSGWHFGPYYWWVKDASIPIIKQAVIACTLFLFALAVAGFATRRAAKNPLKRMRRGSHAHTGKGGFTYTALGLAAVFGSTDILGASIAGFAVLIIGMCAVIFGNAQLLRSTSRWFSKMAIAVRGLRLLLAFRRAAQDNDGSSRLMAVFAVLTMSAGLFSGLLSSLQGRSGSALPDGTSVMFYVNNIDCAQALPAFKTLGLATSLECSYNGLSITYP